MTKVIATNIAKASEQVVDVERRNEILNSTLSAAGQGEEKLDPVNAQLIAQYLGSNGKFLEDGGILYVSADSLGVGLGKMFKHDVSRITDGSHNFEELYDHRCTLFLSLMAVMAEGLSNNEFGVKSVWHSRLHDDGTAFEDYTVVGIDTVYGQCTYHVKDTPYGNFLRQAYPLNEVDRAPKWDGHTSNDVLIRLAASFLGQSLWGTEKKKAAPSELTA